MVDNSADSSQSTPVRAEYQKSSGISEVEQDSWEGPLSSSSAPMRHKSVLAWILCDRLSSRERQKRVMPRCAAAAVYMMVQIASNTYFFHVRARDDRLGCADWHSAGSLSRRDSLQEGHRPEDHEYRVHACRRLAGHRHTGRTRTKEERLKNDGHKRLRRMRSNQSGKSIRGADVGIAKRIRGVVCNDRHFPWTRFFRRDVQRRARNLPLSRV